MKNLSHWKTRAERLPEPLGRIFSYVPYSLRLGKQYKKSSREIDIFDRLSVDAQCYYIFKRVKQIVEYAENFNPFYRRFYASEEFHSQELNDFSDLTSIPIVTKSELQKHSIEDRSSAADGRLKTNTGGASGEPLAFYLDADAFAREWAHMHRIWSQLDYHSSDLKLTFRGKNVGDNPLVYNPVHNEYYVNAYAGLKSVAEAVFVTARKRSIRFIHGYPSAIYAFAKYCEEDHPSVVQVLRSSLRGVFLASEYPAPVYRNVIERVFDTETLSWYGHSEMAVLAYEDEHKFRYSPMQTYGYAESVRQADGSHHLVGTSYYNVTSPFIRYDTTDLITPLESDAGILSSFKIAQGRYGDFIYDKSGHAVSLTAFIFGRHHRIFEFAQFVQVQQAVPGEATLMVTLPGTEINPPGTANWETLFDTGNVDIDFSFVRLDEPFRSPSGKVPLIFPASEHSGIKP